MSRTEAQSVDDCDGKAPVLSLSALLCVLRLTVTMFSTAGCELFSVSSVTEFL